VLKGKNNVIEDQYSIAFIDADGTWICVHFKDQDKANQLSTDNLEDIIELLDPNLFLRVHKCGIINMECVIGVRYYARNIIAILEGPNEITVALSKKEIFNKMYNDVKQKRALKAMQNIVQR
jgi:DNA-binding LytR/AlgR family response regulator